jgi:hypothetical protein
MNTPLPLHKKFTSLYKLKKMNFIITIISQYYISGTG